MIKKLLTILTLIVLFFASTIAQNKALLIAIAEYPENSGWHSLSSENDLDHIQKALSELGFENENIQIVKNEKATKIEILKQLYELLNETNEGDNIFIHYSGHGQQVVDDNFDESDLLDEALVPYNSYAYYKDEFKEGAFLIRDDLLEYYIQKIRTKAGKKGQVILTIDACHSGFSNLSITTDNLIVSKNEAYFLDKKNDNMAGLCCLFASSANELNFETFDENEKEVGCLSFVLSNILKNVEFPYAFESLKNDLKKELEFHAPNQNPQFFCTDKIINFQKPYN